MLGLTSTKSKDELKLNVEDPGPQFSSVQTRASTSLVCLRGSGPLAPLGPFDGNAKQGTIIFSFLPGNKTRPKPNLTSNIYLPTLIVFFPRGIYSRKKKHCTQYNNNNNRRLVTLAEHTSDHGRQTNSSTEEKGEQV